MQNKIISIILTMLLTSQTLMMALEFDTTSTQGGSWTDDNSGMTYTSYGKKRYSFQKRTTQFTPWFKGRPPSIKAGCGGVSLDGGFTAFLNLEEIGDQLETAISSAGMGVVVVLLQTLPSIGKAFEDIQKLVRKIQQMLQNACQLTVSALSKNETIKNAKDDMQKNVDDLWGNNAISKKMDGATEWLDGAMQASTCPDTDEKCKKNTQSILFKSLAKSLSNKVYINNCIAGMDKKVCNKIIENTGKNVGVKVSSISSLLNDSKFNGASISIDSIDKTMMKLKYSIFGVLAVDSSNSLSDHIDANGNINKDGVLAKLASNSSSSPVSIKLNWIKPKNKIDDVLKFLTGDSDINATDTRKLVIPGNFNIVSSKYCPESSKNAGCESNYVSLIYLEETKDSNATDIEVVWEGLYKNTYKTIMHYIDPNNPAPTTEIGVFLPQGSKYISYIQRYSGRDSSSNALYYADILARTNVIYAVKFLINEIEQEAISLETDQLNKGVIQLYLNNVQKIVNSLKEQMVDYPGDVEYLDHIQNIFNELERQNKYRKSRKQGN